MFCVWSGGEGNLWVRLVFGVSICSTLILAFSENYERAPDGVNTYLIYEIITYFIVTSLVTTITQPEVGQRGKGYLASISQLPIQDGLNTFSRKSD